MEKFAQIFAEYQDNLAPKLDVYEQAVYLYILRHTEIESKRETVIGFKSARKKLGFGIGKAGSPPSEGVIYEKLKSLETKGCVSLLGSERSGTRIRIFLPREIHGLIVDAPPVPRITLEDMDFFTSTENRKLILERENWKCFYCLIELDENNHVIEHVVSRPKGNNSFRNVVASCRRCNNRKSETLAIDFLRGLYREGLLSAEDLETRVAYLERLNSGELRPTLL